MDLFPGTELGCTEGPHMYRKDGYYYLLLAEGGTGYEHAVSIVRSRNLQGPYEQAPHHPLLTASGRRELGLQKTGHGSLVEGPDGRWYLPHLCGRPEGPNRRCILGREAAMQVVDWPEGEWPRLASGGNGPADVIELPWVKESPDAGASFADDFDGSQLGLEWNTLREPADASWLDMVSRKGWLQLRGRYSLQSQFDQSLVGVRVTALRSKVSVVIDYQPTHYQQTAGLVFYYNTRTYHYLQVGFDKGRGRVLRIHSADSRDYRFAMNEPVELPVTGAVQLHATLDEGKLRYGWSVEGGEISMVGPELEATVLSDDHVIDSGAWGFTGCFAALCAQDATDVGPWAAFARFRQRRID